jgi:peptidoglycan/xylan/chitin deacetylase (PgdA/CDA1 family)
MPDIRLPLFAALAAGLLLVAGCGSSAQRQGAAKPSPRPVPRPHRRPRRKPPLALALPQRLPDRRVVLPILMYHRIDVLRPTLPAMTRGLTVAPADFAAQMRWLHRHGFHAISALQAFAALEQGAPLPPKPVMITFDDGYRDVLRYAAPVLEELGMPATSFVITDRVSDGDPSFLTWAELRRLEADGVAIGSHTVHHVALTDLSDGSARWELRRSASTLARHLGHPVQWFSYPMGRADGHVAELARRAGYVLAVTTSPGSTQDAREPLLLHRDEVLDTTGVAGLASLIGG